jgi:hypothetical protein
MARLGLVAGPTFLLVRPHDADIVIMPARGSDKPRPRDLMFPQADETHYVRLIPTFMVN